MENTQHAQGEERAFVHSLWVPRPRLGIEPRSRAKRVLSQDEYCRGRHRVCYCRPSLHPTFACCSALWVRTYVFLQFEEIFQVEIAKH